MLDCSLLVVAAPARPLRSRPGGHSSTSQEWVAGRNLDETTIFLICMCIYIYIEYIYIYIYVSSKIWFLNVP